MCLRLSLVWGPLVAVNQALVRRERPTLTLVLEAPSAPLLDSEHKLRISAVTDDLQFPSTPLLDSEQKLRRGAVSYNQPKRHLCLKYATN